MSFGKIFNFQVPRLNHGVIPLLVFSYRGLGAQYEVEKNSVGLTGLALSQGLTSLVKGRNVHL